MALPPSSTLAVITLINRSGAPLEAVRFGTAPAASFGEVDGNSIQGVTRVGGR